MKRLITSAKEESRGVFWVIDNQLLAFPFYGDSTIGVAKSGNTYNHKKLWKEICPREYRKYPYNYFPRGRVELSNKGKPIIYINPNIEDSTIQDIKVEFGLLGEPTIKYDNSQHYKCYLDEGWKPDK